MAENQKVKEVQARIKDSFEAETGVFNNSDYQRVQTDSKYVMRFLDEKDQDVDKAFKMLEETLKWRNSFGVASIKRSDFSMEAFAWGGTFAYVPDKNGVPVLYIRMSMQICISEWRDLTKRLMVYHYEEMERRAAEAGKKWGLVFDCRDAGVGNFDLKTMQFALNTLTDHYPQNMEYTLVYEMPLILRAVFTLMQSWLPKHYKNIFKFLKGDEIVEVIGKENLPDFLGGTCKTPYCHFYKDCPSADEVGKIHGFSQKSVEEVKTKFGKYVEEARSKMLAH